MFRGGFRIMSTGPDTLQIDPASTIMISKERYQPLGSDFLLGGVDLESGGNGTDQELCISSRVFMTDNQILAEDNSIAFATSDVDNPPQEIFIEQKSNVDASPTARTAPYEPFHIKGLGFDFTPKWNDDARLRDYIYLELDLWDNLDIRSASIVVGPVGGNGAGIIPGEESERVDFQDGEEVLLGWPSFPSRYLFNLELDSNGELVDSITKTPIDSEGEEVFNGPRFQKKAYILLGYLSQDFLVNEFSIIIRDDEEGDFGVVPCVNSNLIIEHRLQNETPVVSLAPYFGIGQVDSNYFTLE